MRDVPMSRNDAENVVDLLEDCDREKCGSWRFDLAAEIRELFGMITMEQEKEARREK